MEDVNINMFSIKSLIENARIMGSQDLIPSSSLDESSQQVFYEKEIDKELFLSLLRNYKYLWDVSDPSCKERKKKSNA